MTENEQMQKIYGNVPNVFEAGRNSLKNDVANALKGRASGEVVALKDVSPVGHNLKCSVNSKNLIPFPYFQTYKNENGVEFKVLDDGGISIKGTPTVNTFFGIQQNSNYGDKEFTTADTANTNGKYTFSPWLNYNANNKILSVLASKSRTYDTIIYPQIELGTAATAYTPYIADIEAVKVKAQGANLLDIDSLQGTVSGVFTKDGDVYTLKNIEGQRSTIHYPFYIPKGKEVSASIEHIQVSIANGAESSGTVFIQFYDAEKKPKDSIQLKLDAPTRTITTTTEIHYVRLFLPSFTSYGDYVKFKDLQLELGSPTEYEPYIAPVEYEQGEAIESIHPGMTITTDTEGALVEVEYNRDINKAFEEITNAIISMGGYL